MNDILREGEREIKLNFVRMGGLHFDPLKNLIYFFHISTLPSSRMQSAAQPGRLHLFDFKIDNMLLYIPDRFVAISFAVCLILSRSKT